ncbi:MAG: YheV family putative metal-binding protein [Spongiibacteraceae bacterium]
MASEFKGRQFIAGAVCPKCALEDKIVMYRVSSNEQVRECVRCGFKESIFDEKPPKKELDTRVNQPRLGEQALPHEDEISVVKLVDPSAGSHRKDH